MTAADAIKVLTFTTLYPNSIQDSHGIFVENRLRHLVASGQAEARVMAPVPWFPLGGRAFGRDADFTRVPSEEIRFDIEVLHPRYPVIPKVGMTLSPLLLYRATRSALQRQIALGFDFDLIDAHYFYPDGVAAVLLGKLFKKPVVITGRGTDINLIPRYALPRRMIRWAADNAAGLVTVCEALKRELANLGVDPERIRVLRNGVDLSMFRPVDRDSVRGQLDLRGPTLLSAGNLVPLKGHDLVIRALSKVPEATLLIAGEGPNRAALERLAQDLGMNDWVRFLGAVSHEQMCKVYNAADLLVLASEREGWPNVLLEAMACGTPALASSVGGVPEVIRSTAAGLLLSDRKPQTIADSVRALLRNPPARAETRAYAEGFDWSQTTQGQLDLFRDILDVKAVALHAGGL